MQAMSTMTRVAIATFLLVALFLLTGGDACDKVPTMSIDEACTKACSTATPPLVQICQTTLGAAGAAATEEISAYALAAATVARGAYDASMTTVNQQLENPALHRDERAAYDGCKKHYGEAQMLMASVIDQLSGCSFGDATRQEYFDASVAVRTCGDWLITFPASPLYAMNLADQEKTLLACNLGGLIVGK